MAYITVADLRAYLDMTAKDTFTASAADDTLTLSSVRVHETMKTKLPVTVSSTNTLPAPLAANTIYYVIDGTDQTIQLATTEANADAGTDIDITDAGLGTHTLLKAINDETLLEEAIEDATDYINRETNRVFEAETLTKYFDSSVRSHERSDTIFINDDLLTITTLKNGDGSATVIAAGDYWLLDRNDGPPYHGIQLTDASGVVWEWDTDGWVEITGTWGYSTTAPNDIRRACLRLSAFYFRQKDSMVFETTAIPEAGVITIPAGIERTMTKIIQKYKRYFE